ncbi:S-adenosyl-L-methionine-dependent methyltransferase [Neoconidiobolus thromboides FSU 785]|nr:S-adenosyl-L-methionine-dependent methyltransferase [Neoconidiobolus thromboides FSU 785]
MATIIPRLPSVKDVIKLYNLTALNQLSQNFILDKNVTDKLLKKANLNFKNALVIEVGPGPGLLTRSILDAGCNNLIAIEKDKRFLPTLEQLSEATGKQMKYVNGDMLKVNPTEILNMSRIPVNQIETVHIVGNLPFGIATPLLLQWLRMMYQKDGFFQNVESSLTLMFQKEVAERIIAGPSCKQRSRLSIMTQAVGNSKIVYNVPSTAFVPRPKVDASVVKITGLKESQLEVPYEYLEQVLRIFFVKRRKTLRRISLDYNEELFKIMEEMGLDLTLRPEDLQVEQYCQLVNKLTPELLKIKV